MRTRFWILTLGVLLGLAAHVVKYTVDAIAASQSANNPAATQSETPGGAKTADPAR